MQIRFLACGYPPPFTICKRAVDSLLKCFSRVVDTLLKGFACGVHYWFDWLSTSCYKTAGRTLIWIKDRRSNKKLMNCQRHLFKYRFTHSYHLQPVSISWNSSFNLLTFSLMYFEFREILRFLVGSSLSFIAEGRFCPIVLSGESLLPASITESDSRSYVLKFWRTSSAFKGTIKPKINCTCICSTA
jgi:hypothetical protein